MNSSAKKRNYPVGHIAQMFENRRVICCAKIAAELAYYAALVAFVIYNWK